MAVYYKFNSERAVYNVDFDGLHISVLDLKKSILHQKRLGKSAEQFDLLISNAQTKEQYVDEQCLIPKNTSLIVARVPINNQHKKSWEVAQSVAVQESRPTQNTTAEAINHVEISRMNGTEDDKIQAMMMQSAADYDPNNYQRVRGINQSGDVPANYRCHRCHKPGHWIKNCPMNPIGKEHHHIKTRPGSTKMTGIPRSLRETLGVDGQEPVQTQFVEEKKREVPEDLTCAICKSIFKDAVMTPCCGSSFCDECVRTALLESDDNECPDCKEKGTSPGSLIPNRFLRNAVAAFHAESSNTLSREKKISEEQSTQEEAEEPAGELVQEEEVTQEEAPKEPEEFLEPDFHKEADNEAMAETEAPVEKDTESEDDDDNITVTVPPAYQQSRGASFRDSRLRRTTSHGVGEFLESYSHSSNTRTHHDDGESYGEESNDSYAQRHQKRSNHGYEHSSSNPPQGISTLVGDEKGSSQNMYPSSHGSNQNLPHGDSQNMYQQQHQAPPPMYQNQNQHGMMPQMHSHQMYPQGPYHQPGPYFPPNNQIRPMRFEHQGNYPPVRHHHMQMMRPMHDNYGMRQQYRPPINNLANAVSQNIQQRFGPGIIDDPLEVFNRLMRENEIKRSERYRRSPIHANNRRSRSFERKRSPVHHQYSPDRRKNYPKTRKRSRSFKRSKSRSFSPNSRGRSKSRSYSPMRGGRTRSRSLSRGYRRKENVQGKDRRDERHRSPVRRGNHHSSRNSRGHNKSDPTSNKHSSRPLQEPQYHDTAGTQHDKSEQNYDYPKESNNFEPPHGFDEQPPPPGEESEPQNIQTSKTFEEHPDKSSADETAVKGSAEVNGSSKVEIDSRKDDVKSEHHHHHHKKSRSKNYETSSDDKKSRDKKKSKKSKEHEKKKSKKDRKDRSEKDKDKKASSKSGSVENTPEAVENNKSVEKQLVGDSIEDNHEIESKEEVGDSTFDEPHNKSTDTEDCSLLKPPAESQAFKRSDSVLDINPHIDDLELDEWIAPEVEVSKWEREEIKSSTSLDNSEADVGVSEVKKPEEKVTSEILKRAENAIFARAISAIRPMENKKVKALQESEMTLSRKETSPLPSLVKRSDDAKLQAFQVTVPANDSGTRSVEIKTTVIGGRDTSRSKKSPLRTSIKNRLGIKVVERKSRTKTPSPKRRLQSDCTKVVRPSRDVSARSQTERSGKSSREAHSSNKHQLSSCIRVSQDTRDSNRNNKSKDNERRRSKTPEDRKSKRFKSSRSRSPSRHNPRRTDQRPIVEKPQLNRSRPKEPARSNEKNVKAVERSHSDNDKARSSRKDAEMEASTSKKKRESSSSSSSSGSRRHKAKKKTSRSPSVDSNSNSKRKKSKKEKKSKKKKKSKK